MSRQTTLILVVAVFLPGLLLPRTAGAVSWQAKVDARVLNAVAYEPTDVLVFLAEQTDLAAATATVDARDRARLVCAALRRTADLTQPPLLSILEDAGAPYRAFWIVNAVSVRVDAALLEKIARRPDVNRVDPDPQVPLPQSDSDGPAPTSREVTWNVAHVGGPEVWATGNTGQDGVIGLLDTGCEWEHPALRDQYRGWNGATADHDYNWYDAVHTGSGPCGHDSPEPCDDIGHGTFVLGAAVGNDDAGPQIGLAPGARWIACRCLDNGWSSPSIYMEGLEWMTAPWPVDGTPGQGDPDRAPDVVLITWFCPTNLGCTWGMLQPVIANVRAAGIVVVAAAGVNGPGCSTIHDPPQIYDEAYTVGASGPDDMIASFSGRGPVIRDQSFRTKPDVCAPGINILTSTPGGDYAWYSGTSVATSQVAAMVALVVTAAPELARDVDAIEARINATAVQLLSNQCDNDGVPNNVYGHGRIDALAACGGVTAAPPAGTTFARLLPAAPNPFNPRTTLSYELAIAGPVDLRIFDAAGRLVRVLVNERSQVEGRYAVAWDGRSDGGRVVAAGVYLGRLSSGGNTDVQRLVLVR